ncbi:MBL fold metallo-hydrolase [Marinicella meishanensis]|uniref:MBL fold metallo-hydrolase n=1 Tax=Marinicella meishanensis TaxID=2873263 RepID=UPI001CC0A94F|nr:MBL fold metallo-hydrolase [Marinicella sp. NBU2979]
MMKRLQWLLTLVVMLTMLALVSGCWRSAQYQKPAVAAPHHGPDRFISQSQKSDSPFWDYLKMRWREGRIESASANDIQAVMVAVDQALIQAETPEPRVTWLGHAAVLVQYQGVSFLTDPHLSDHASPLPFGGPSRVVPPALTVEQLPEVDFVVISHNHYDHLDHETVVALGNRVHWYVPLGIQQWLLKRGIDSDNITELDWWQSESFGPGIEVVATPSQHWSKRTPFDTNKTLWASWHINIHGFKTWFAGDTGYHAQRFQQIGQQLGPHDLALIPIGAYGPRYFMLPQHVDPAQAVQTHLDVKSKHSVGIHWGTFELTHEPFLAPRKLLEESAKELSHGVFETLQVGQTRLLTLQVE